MANVKRKQPTQRTMEYLRKLGHTVAVVERWNPHAKVRQDLFGCIDVLAMPHLYVLNRGLWGFQCTSSSNLSKRRDKALKEPRLALWLANGNRFFLHGWKCNALGRWEVREEEITFSDLERGPASEKPS